MYFILQGYVLVPQFFEKSELESVIAAICELVDQLADKLYDAGKIQGRLFWKACKLKFKLLKLRVSLVFVTSSALGLASNKKRRNAPTIFRAVPEDNKRLLVVYSNQSMDKSFSQRFCTWGVTEDQAVMSFYSHFLWMAYIKT